VSARHERYSLGKLDTESDSKIGYQWIFLVGTPQPTSNDCNSSSFSKSHLGATCLSGVSDTAAGGSAYGRGAARGAGVAATAAGVSATAATVPRTR
jgi:hypothetical protein